METKTTTKTLLLRGAAILALTFATSAVSAQALATVGGTLIDGVTANPSADPTQDPADPLSNPAKVSDEKGIENIVTATGVYNNNDYTNDAFENVDVVTANPKLEITKVASKLTNAAVNDVITYTYTVTNTGNVTLAPVTLDDVHKGKNPDGLVEFECNTLTTDNGTTGDTELTTDSNVITVLGPLDVVTCTAKYTVVQDDVDLLQK